MKITTSPPFISCTSTPIYHDTLSVAYTQRHAHRWDGCCCFKSSNSLWTKQWWECKCQPCYNEWL